MRFVFLGPPDEPDVLETVAFGLAWVRGVPQEVADGGIAAALARHPHFHDVSEEDEAPGIEAPPEGEAAPVMRRRPGRPRKDAA